MKLNLLKNSAVLAVATGTLLVQSVVADVTLVVTGGNASRNVAYERAESILTGATKVTSSNSNLRSYKNGNLVGNPGIGKVTIHFVLNGAAQGLIDLKAQNSVATIQDGNLTPQLAISGTFPETIGLDSAAFTSQRTLVVPFVFIKNPSLPNTIHGVTNLTQRQAAYLEASSGSLPTAFFGGESTSDVLYLVGRNTGAAVRQVIDANIYFTGTPAFWVTNTVGPALPPIPDTSGQAAGGAVANNIGVIPNAIGTVASGDIGSYTALSYEGVPFTPANVANGSYPIWGYEAWYYKNSGSGQPSANQLTVINALIAAVTDTTYQHASGNAFATGKYVPLDDLQVDRTADGGPISSTIY